MSGDGNGERDFFRLQLRIICNLVIFFPFRLPCNATMTRESFTPKQGTTYNIVELVSCKLGLGLNQKDRIDPSLDSTEISTMYSTSGR